ncbi:MAG: hypothetical protein AABY16_04110 [Nanoarchaeota archaeon]
MEEGEDISFEELNEMKEENIDFDSSATTVNEGVCPGCNEKLVKVVENRNILDGTITIHIIKLRCPKCGKEYLDMDQAEKYDFALTLEQASKEPLELLSKRILNKKA